MGIYVLYLRRNIDCLMHPSHKQWSYGDFKLSIIIIRQLSIEWLMSEGGVILSLWARVNLHGKNRTTGPSGRSNAKKSIDYINR